MARGTCSGHTMGDPMAADNRIRSVVLYLVRAPSKHVNTVWKGMHSTTRTCRSPAATGTAWTRRH